MRRARVLLADDHPAMLDRVAALLARDFEIVAKTGDGSSAVTRARQLEPDVVILDIAMPILNGIQAARGLKKSGSKAKTVILTVHDDRDYLNECLAARALGYVVKSRVATDLVLAIKEALMNLVFVSPTDTLVSELNAE